MSSLRLAVVLLGMGCSGLTVSDSDVRDLQCPVDVCGATCTDIDQDPFNCGDCGVTCVVPNARPVCIDGGCELGTCVTGWADCDGDPLNGCEAEALCIDGSPCDTACGSTGTLDCDDACAPVCVEPVETCNLQDDDCDGACDEELDGCRRSVYRSFGGLGHVYGLDLAEPDRLGQGVEAPRYFQVMVEPAEGTVALYRCDQGDGRRLLTTSSRCEALDQPPELTMGYIAEGPVCGAIPLYRLYSPGRGTYFYTLTATERDRAVGLGYTSQGIEGYVFPSSR